MKSQEINMRYNKTCLIVIVFVLSLLYLLFVSQRIRSTLQQIDVHEIKKSFKRLNDPFKWFGFGDFLTGSIEIKVIQNNIFRFCFERLQV